MFANPLDCPTLFRHVLESLPVGIYLVDRERRIRFWNRGAENITGHLSHDVVGHFPEDVVQACDRHGSRLSSGQRPVLTTLTQQQPQQCTVFYLHKKGHRVPVNIRTRPIFEEGDGIRGATVVFEEALVYHEELSGPPMYGCLDATTGIPSRRLTRAVLSECMAGSTESHLGFGMVRIRVLGLDEFRSMHGPQSIVPFLRTAAHTLRHSLDAETFLGCWEENEFLALLPSASPVTVATTAETLWQMLSRSEISWWGDHFQVKAEVSYTVASPSGDLGSLLGAMTPAHSSAQSKTLAAGSANDSGRLRG